MALEQKMQDSAHYRPNTLVRLATGAYIAYQFFGGGVDKAIAQQYGNEPQSQQSLAGQMIARLPDDMQKERFEYSRLFKVNAPKELTELIQKTDLDRYHSLKESNKGQELVDGLREFLQYVSSDRRYDLDKTTAEKFADLLNILGIGLMRTERYKEAVATFKLASFNSSDRTAYLNLGGVYCKMGEYQKAVGVLEFFLEDPTNPEGKNIAEFLLRKAKRKLSKTKSRESD